MIDKQTGGSLSAWVSRSIRMTVLAVMLVSTGTSVDAQAPSATSPANKLGTHMKQFAFIFRQGKRVLSEAELKQRTDEVRAWALSLRKQGRKLDPHILGEESFHVAPDSEKDSTSASGEDPVTAIVFFEAADIGEAVKIAKTHPGLHYGVSVEVREWSVPQPPPTSNSPK